MEFLVLFPDGRTFGPASVQTLSEWAQQGRLLPNTTLENLGTRERVTAGSVAGIFPAPSQPESFGSPAAYPRYFTPAASYAQPIDGMAIASLVLGILSIIPFCIWFVAIPLGIMALIFGFLGNKGSSKGIAVGGIVCGIVGIVIALIFVLLIYSNRGRGWF